jgi:hypothetical protein
MSYCRFSSDHFRSHLYCYESDEGFVIHIAARKAIIDRSLLKPVTSSIQDIIDNNYILNDLLSECEYEEINLPYAGETFIEETEQDMYKRILELNKLGYYVPQDLLNEIEESL